MLTTITMAAVAALLSTSASPAIVGGSDATSAPWAAALYGANTDTSPTGFHCSGTIIAPKWILTARHCITDGNNRAHLGSLNRQHGTEIKFARTFTDPDADIGLAELTDEYQTTYSELATVNPAKGDVNDIYGWGMVAKPTGTIPENLKTATVKVDSVKGGLIKSKGGSGYAWKGDSGGPEMAGGKQVGVCSKAGTTSATQTYVSVVDNITWIRSTMTS